MRYVVALLVLLSLACCGAPQPEPPDETSVFEASTLCRASHDGAPAMADRGIGGTGISARTRTSDRGIGGTGIFGVVTGFASICVDGQEVRFDKTVPVSMNGAAATARQLRIGQVVVIETAAQEQARTISVRYEVSGPIEAVEAGAMVVAGQRVIVLPSTWVAGRFALGNWTAVSGLRQPDGSIVASRLDRGPAGQVSVRGQIVREGDTTRIGGLVLRGSPLSIVRTGAFVWIAGRYADRSAEVRSIDADPLLDDPAGYFGESAHQIIVQGFVRVHRGMVWLNNGRSFQAGPGVQGIGNSYRNAVVRLERTASGAFIATALHYTAYRAQPAVSPVRSKGHGAGDLVLPPEAPPGPPADKPLPDAPDPDNEAPGLVPDSSPDDAVISKLASPLAGPSGDRLFVRDRSFAAPLRVIAGLD